MKTSGARLLAVLVVVGMAVSAATAVADIDNFQISGQIYTKWLYRNNDQMGIVTWGNPFWPENFSGENGVGSEFEWLIEGTPSRFVTARVRLKSRFGSTWQDFWENGDINYPEENTSGETLGMDHAEYMKLRGYTMEIRPPYAWLDTIIVGSSDLGFWNPWTIGRVRFIDRDNAKGVFFQGSFLNGDLSYTLGAIAMPRLWAGPGWSTGVGDVVLNNPFYTNDWAYALHLDYYVDPVDLQIILDAAITTDFEINTADPDAIGSDFPDCADDLGNPIPGCVQDQRVSLGMRYSQAMGTLQLKFEIPRDVLWDVLVGLSSQNVNANYMANGVAQNNGVSPMPFKDTLDYALRARLEFFEPFGLQDFTVLLEYFNIGTDWVATMGARREADVLLTDGFISGGQIPTLNIANEFQDFDEPFFESCIGWHGITGIFDQLVGDFQFNLEGTWLTYNTNMQDRDVATVYPDFLFNQGYTDTWFWDFANILDRGRDTRAVYAENQDRMSVITGLRSIWDTGWLTGLVLELYLKYIYDQDNRDLDAAADPDRPGLQIDDYRAHLFFSELVLGLPLNDELRLEVGGNYDIWDERSRSGDTATGYQDYWTRRARAFAGFSFTFGGATFEYRGEFLHKYQERTIAGNRNFTIFRSKAYLIVAW